MPSDSTPPDLPDLGGISLAKAEPYGSLFEKEIVALTKWQWRATCLSSCVSVVTLFALVISVWSLVDQVKQARILTEKNNYISSAGWTLELDKIFIDHPELYPYFNAGQEMSTADSQETKYLLISTSELIMDSMDSILSNYDDEWPDDGWRNWAYDAFRESPSLREHLQNRRSWYCRYLYPKYLEWAKTEGMIVPAQPRCHERGTR